MGAIEYEFDFEELRICIIDRQEDGGLFFGCAILKANDECADEFYVDRIKLASGTVLKRKGSGFLGFPDPFADTLFHRMAAVIEDDKTIIGKSAVAEWSSHVEELRTDVAA